MICQEYEAVCKYLKDKEIQLSSNNIWLKSCIDLYKHNIETRNTYRSLNEYVCIQWLLSDLQDVQHSVLPTDCLTGKTELTGKYSVQINWMRDIGQSCYSQLQAAQNIKESESNDFVSVDEPKKQAWEPKPKRVLMMEITDGVTVLKAMEYSPIAKLDDSFLPGMKIFLMGPIECRNGILFLKNNNISLLGGEVENFHEMNSKENLLKQCLNIPVSSSTKSQPLQERCASTVVSSSARRTSVPTKKSELIIDTALVTTNKNSCSDAIESSVLSRIEQMPDSTSTVEHDIQHVRDKDVLMTDEDDEFLNQLPDDILYNSNSFNPHPSNYSPMLNESPVKINSKLTYFDGKRDESSSLESHTKQSKELNKLKPRLFPSLKNLNSNIEEKSFLNNGVLLATASKELLIKPEAQTLQISEVPGTSFNRRNSCNVTNENSLDETCPSSTSFKSSSILEETIPSVNYSTKRLDHAEHDVSNTRFPQHKQFLVKVESLAKIKIKNSEWQCCANVVIEDQFLNVVISDKVCEIVIGISAFELEKLRGQMATDQKLKNKVNSILKAGQTKLMSLNCKMTLAYSSEDCIPEVVSINEV